MSEPKKEESKEPDSNNPTSIALAQKEKKPKKEKVKLKLEWIFGIRKDMYPNIYYLCEGTFVYPASHYVVIFNYDRKLGPGNLQHFIEGRNHSKGFTAIATYHNTQNYTNEKIVGVAEELEDQTIIDFYKIVGRTGKLNVPELNGNSIETGVQKIHAMAFSQRIGKDDNYFVAFGSSLQKVQFESQGNSSKAGESEPEQRRFYFIIRKWELGKKEKKVEIPDLEIVNIEEKFEITFSTYSSLTSDQDEMEFCLSCQSFAAFYRINLNAKSDDNVAELTWKHPPEGSQVDEDFRILSSCWLADGYWVCLSNQNIEIKKTNKNSADTGEKETFQELPNEKYTIVVPYNSAVYEGFIAAGLEGTMHFFLRKTDTNDKGSDSDLELDVDEKDPLSKPQPGQENPYLRKFKKTNYDFLPGINEKIMSDKQGSNKANVQMDKQLEFHSIICIEGKEVFATTNTNDLFKINVDPKTMSKAKVEYCISPFHAGSIEGMDCCINKPYLLTCSADQTVKVWDYQDKVQLLSRSYDDKLSSVAFHPSGMYGLLSTEDKIYSLGIYYDIIEKKKNQSISIKGCKDLKFSNLGHLFAIGSSNVVKIYDFLNMQEFKAPPGNNPRIKQLNTTNGTKANSISWTSLDKNCLIGCNHMCIDWNVKKDDSNNFEFKDNDKNFLSYVYSEITKDYIATTDDNNIIKFKDVDTFEIKEQDYQIKELNLMPYHDICFGATALSKHQLYEVIQLQSEGNNSNKPRENYTTCLRVFQDYGKDFENHIDFPAHFGEIKRVRLNNEGTKIFTCGEDGCINIYTIELTSDLLSDLVGDIQPKFTKTVLIDKSSNKTRETNKKDLPAKREDFLKKTRNDNNDKKESKKKKLEDLKAKIQQLSITENQKIKELKNKVSRGKENNDDVLKKTTQDNKGLIEEQKNQDQIDLAKLTRQIDAIRENQRKVNEDGQAEKKQSQLDFERKMEGMIAEFQEKKDKLESHKREIEGKKIKLEDDKKKDGIALKNINEEIIKRIGNSVDDLRRKIDELTTHYSHDIKKKKEERDKLEEDGQALILEIRKMNEDKSKQDLLLTNQNAKKKEVEDKMAKITKQISEIENKIIECKKSHTYLEKCKFVLSYKIQELKKEAGPMEKVLEDLQKRTKEDELSLSKYIKEYDIICQKVVNLEDLQAKTKAHEKSERDLKAEINNFKIDLYNMLKNIDDFEKLKEGFRNLRDKYLKSYKPDVQDHELEGEFANQKAKMKNRVLELQEELIKNKKKHKDNIKNNRDDNNKMIKEIQDLKMDIKMVKKKKNDFSGDQKHANAVAEIKAGEYIKHLMMQDISLKEKIELFTKKIEEKKKKLEEIKQVVKVTGLDGREINEDGTPYTPNEEEE